MKKLVIVLTLVLAVGCTTKQAREIFKGDRKPYQENSSTADIPVTFTYPEIEGFAWEESFVDATIYESCLLEGGESTDGYLGTVTLSSLESIGHTNKVNFQPNKRYFIEYGWGGGGASCLIQFRFDTEVKSEYIFKFGHEIGGCYVNATKSPMESSTAPAVRIPNIVYHDKGKLAEALGLRALNWRNCENWKDDT